MVEILEKCDVCGSDTYEGDLGESWWICKNKECKKNNPDWVDKECFESIREEHESLELKIKKLSEINILGNKTTIDLDIPRWIGDGSGVITIESLERIKFYIKEQELFYMTENEEVLQELHKLSKRLLMLWGLKIRQLELFGRK
jgi:hypothetical protein